MTTRCQSLSLVVSLIVTRCTTHCHSLPLYVIRCNTRCHTFSFDVSLVCLFINDQDIAVLGKVLGKVVVRSKTRLLEKKKN